MYAVYNEILDISKLYSMGFFSIHLIYILIKRILSYFTIFLIDIDMLKHCANQSNFVFIQYFSLILIACILKNAAKNS